MIVMIGHLSNMKLATGVDHIIYGALFFAIIIFIMFFIGSFWRDPETKQEKTSNIKINRNNYSNKLNSIVIITVLISTVTWPLTSQLLASNYQAQTYIPQLPALTQNKLWQEVKAPNWNWRPQFDGVANDSLRYFKNQESVIGLYQANFGNEKQGSELINMQNELINAEDRKKWHFIKKSSLTLTNPENNTSMTVDYAKLRGSSTDIIATKWYQVGHIKTNSPYLAKIFQLYKRLTLDSTAETYYVVFTNQSPNKAASPSLMQKFITQLFL